MKKLILLGVLLGLFNHAHADSFRCGSSLIKDGDSVNELLKKCGDPQRKYSTTEEIIDQGRQYRTGVTNWVYKRSGKKDMLVSVRNGVVVKAQPD